MQRRRIRNRSPANGDEHHPKSFVKIILPSAIHGTQTRIPELFIRSFGDELSGFASITVHNGDHWEIGLKKCGKDDAWFCTNWPEFAKYYSISYGFILIFDYKGDSKFHVRIYDTTATEICYPCSTRGRGPGRPWKRSRVEHQHHQQQHQASCETRSKKHKEIEITDRVDDNNDVNLPSKNQRSTSLGRQGKSPRNRKRTGRRSGGGRALVSNSSSERAKEAATKLKPKNPCFLATIRNCPVYVPAEFAAKHLKRKDSIQLQNSSGQRWDVSCTIHQRTSRAKRLGQKGWRNFARENRVSLGDVCVFEVIKRRPVVVLKVEISRCT